MRDWTADELAQAAGTTSRWIRDLCADGRLEGAYKRVSAWFIPYEVGQKWLEKRKEAVSHSAEQETAS
ncbi:MAG: hypothetical protein JXA21_07335 [Anaerolineae bacterium]|nr:hypothetical protein [Anaerolineae bacterium]